MDACPDRSPYISLIACVLVVTGSGLMCGTNYEALRRTSALFDYRFYPIDEPRVLQVIGIVYTVLTIISAVVNVVAGVSTTGQTRQRVYGHQKSQVSGRNYSNFLLVTTYFVAFAWSLLFVAFAAPVTLWVMLHTVCREETEYWRGISADKDETEFTYTFNLTHYGLYRRPLDTSVYSETANSPSAVTQLCQEISTVGPLFLIALASSFLVIYGLTCFISCLSSAVVRLELASEIDRIRRAPSSSHLVPTSEEYSLQPLLHQSQHYAHRSPIDGHLNAFTYTNAVGSSLTGQVHPHLVTPLSAGIVTPPGLTPHQPHYTMQR